MVNLSKALDPVISANTSELPIYFVIYLHCSVVELSIQIGENSTEKAFFYLNYSISDYFESRLFNN